MNIHFDFSAVLVLLTALSGMVWLLDRFWMAPRRRANAEVEDAAKPGPFIEFCLSFFPVILIVLILRSFVAEPFRIPSGSMLPTLYIGDFILVNKFSYGLRLPVLHTKIMDVGEPQRGDIAVFRHPPDPSKDYIKRIIGLPGDTIRYVNKHLYINGKAVDTEYLGNFDGPGMPPFLQVQEYREDLMGIDHHILKVPARVVISDDTWMVPDNAYFAMGDNRDNSEDSRVWGFVPESHLVGKAFYIWMSWNIDTNRPDFKRIGKSVK